MVYLVNLAMFLLLMLLADINICSTIESLNICGEWISFKNEKCFKFDNKLGTEEEAKTYCYELDSTSTLITIESQEEQDFVSENLRQYHTISDRVWMGMNIHELVVDRWNGKNKYVNWAEGSADVIAYQHCVQMSLSKATFGKWIDEPCRRKGLFACQRHQQWTVDTLRKILIDIWTKVDSYKYEQLFENQTKTVEKLWNSLERQQTEIKEQKEIIENMDKSFDKKLDKIVNELGHQQNNKQEYIPIGFVYIQLPNQSEPQSLWSNFQWKDITQEYSGLFFRAEGKDSAPFGEIQLANVTTISNIMSAAILDINYSKVEGRQYELNEGWSPNLVPGKALSDLYIHKSNGENRPRNTAIRFWKRV